MNYNPRFAAVCGDARLPAHRTGRLLEKKIPLQPHETCKEWDAQTLRELLASKLAGDQSRKVK